VAASGRHTLDDDIAGLESHGLRLAPCPAAPRELLIVPSTVCNNGTRTGQDLGDDDTVAVDCRHT
jgi:hypothetical protein